MKNRSKLRKEISLKEKIMMRRMKNDYEFIILEN
jgi:hypothetical protein